MSGTVDDVSDEVAAAFALLAEELGFAADDIRLRIDRALRSDDIQNARDLVERADGVKGLRHQLKDLAREWDGMGLRAPPAGDADIPLASSQSSQRRDLGRLPRGQRTPELTFRRPILEALIELGGTARIGEVLELVGQQLEDRLQPVDHEELASGKGQVRWRNTAQWSRNELVRDGLMEPSRRYGEWAISDAGRAHLERTEGV